MGAAERFRGQLLHRPPGSAEDAVRHLLAVQAQDARAVRLALRARVDGPLDGDFVVTWLMRGTLHLVLREDLWWLHALCAPRMAAGNARRLKQLDVTDPDRAVAAILRTLEDGPLTRAELAERHEARGQRIVHLLARAAMQGKVVMDVERRFVRVSPPRRAPDRDASLRELGRRYAAAHPGADARDLARWSGLPVSDFQGTPGEPGLTPLRLIPAFDELLLGWRDRSPTVPAALAKRVHPGGGVLRAVVLEDGVAVGTWSKRGVDAAVRDTRALADEIAHMASIAAHEEAEDGPGGP